MGQVRNKRKMNGKLVFALTCGLGAMSSIGYSADADSVLPIRHQCHSSLLIWAQDMNASELSDTCSQLVAQESSFHALLETGQVPVADDYNESLRVVVFDDYREYDTYGYSLFGINTNNGGVYIEGDPSDANNQASFYAHEADWLRPEFSIWNLRHEVIHYLDGRFISYGGFNHFPSNMVWWSEGLAEYLSLGTNNIDAVNLVKNLKNKRRRKSLAKIFDVSYREKVDAVYRWTYLAVRFMFERHHSDVIAMTQSLKSNDFASYKHSLDTWEVAYQDEFNQWLDALIQKSSSQINSTDDSNIDDSKGNAQARNRRLQRHSEKHL